MGIMDNMSSAARSALRGSVNNVVGVTAPLREAAAATYTSAGMAEHQEQHSDGNRANARDQLSSSQQRHSGGRCD